MVGHWNPGDRCVATNKNVCRYGRIVRRPDDTLGVVWDSDTVDESGMTYNSGEGFIAPYKEGDK